MLLVHHVLDQLPVQPADHSLRRLLQAQRQGQQPVLQEDHSRVHLLQRHFHQDQFQRLPQHLTVLVQGFHSSQPLRLLTFPLVVDLILVVSQTDLEIEHLRRPLVVQSNLEVLDSEMLYQEVKAVKIVNLQHYS